jgi:acyl transferase domain-containing protein/ubiquinone/menaquinone biosynthesis C-methylase UbiE
VAIVGIGLRFPGRANNPAALWKILRDGVDAVTEIPPDRWSIKKFYDPEPGTPGKTNARWGGFVEGIDRFDADFFGISPREAARMDPQQRLLLEVAWEALEDAGLPAERLEGTNTGVFIGLSSTDYMLIQQSSGDLESIDAHTNTGGAMSIAANRISYCLNLRGPSISLDTACSSSLVAVHEACQSIWDGECPVALAGGVNVLIKPEPYIGFSRLSMLSADGRCKAFDAAANGFVRSEGAAVIVLKPLDRALSDGDRIYSVILSSACNQDGHTTGLTVPSEKAQEELVRRACEEAGIEPGLVQFVEAHGPGTLVGDPIEARALGAVLGQDRERPCILGSIKTNIGHLEPAAGIAGLIKVALALEHDEIPRNLHFHEPNPAIPLDKLKLRVPTETERWHREGGPPLAGVNSFGFGGTNAHVVLQQYDPAVHGRAASAAAPAAAADRHALVVPLSARSAPALASYARELHEQLGPAGSARDATLSDVAFTMALRRSHHGHRAAIVAANREELLDKLVGLADGEPRPGLATGRVLGQPPRVAFVCSGQGPQWWAMGRELIATEPVFRAAIDECDAIVRRLGDWSLRTELLASEADSRMQETSISQPAIFAMQVALGRLWESWGVRPDALVGHSVGEVAAAHLAGALSLEDAVRTIYHRGRCMDFAEAHGRMLAVGLPMQEALTLVEGREDRISLAANNSPGSVTLSGDGATLEAIAGELDGRGVFNKFLRVQYAFHSPQMEPMRTELLTSLEGIRPEPARVPLWSTVTGERADGAELVPEYWWRNVRQYVRFAQAIERMLDDGQTVFVELSPHPVLSGSVVETAHARRAKVTALASLRRGEPELPQMLHGLGGLFTLGVAVDWPALVVGGRFVDLPRYPWQKESHWAEGEESRSFRLGDTAHPLLGKRLAAARPTWEGKVDARVLRYLADHRVQGQVLLSGTSYVEMVLAAARELYGPGAYAVEELELHKACFLGDDHSTTLQLVLDPDDSTFAIYSRPRGNGEAWTAHVRGKVRSYNANGVNDAVDLDEVRRRCGEVLDGEQCYEHLGRLGLDYGPAFRGIDRLWRGDGEALGRIELPPALREGLDGYQLHPALLDACFQVLAGALGRGANGAQGVYLPVLYERIRVRGRAVGPVWSHARLVEQTGRGVVAEVDVLDDQGHPLLEVRGLRCQAVEGSGDGAVARDARELVYEYRWKLAPRPADAALRTAEQLPGPAEIVGSTAEEARRLVEDLGLTDKYRRLEREVNDLCSSFLLDSFARLGGRLEVGQRFTTTELARRLNVDPRYDRLMHRYLEMLAADGLVRLDEEAWTVLSAPDPGDPRRTWQDVLARNPAFYAELTLLGRCAHELPEILRGGVDPLHLIFPDGSLAVAEHLYQDSPSLRFYNTLVQRAVKRMAEKLPSGRMLHVLEIGAGTGGMSSYVLPVLPPDRTRYVYTDLSNHFFQKAQEKFADFPFVDYQRLDIELDPTEQGFTPHSFDLILASECLHATKAMRETMRNVNKLLASDGLLVLLEAVRPVRWVDLVFGLTDGWWRFTDTDLRSQYPLLTFERWQGLLDEFGYAEVREASGRPAAEIENAVIIARGPRVAEAAAQSAEADHADGATNGERRAGSWLIFADAGGHGERLAVALEDRGDRVVRVTPGTSFAAKGEERYEIDPASRDDARRLVRVLEGTTPWKGIVHLWMLDAPATAEATIASLDEMLVRGCLSVVHVAQVLSETALAEPPRLWLVSAGAQSVGRVPEPTAAPQGALWGLGRVVMNEVPKLRTTIVDVDPAQLDDSVASLVAELDLDEHADELALRGGARYVHRYVRSADLEDAAESKTVVAAGSQAYRLETSRQGTLDRLTLRACRRPRLEAGQVEIRVQATGLNFADVMKALGLYPGLPDGPVPLGIECAGRVTAVGAGVERFRPGDEVVAIAPFAFGAFVVTAAAFVAPKPPELSFEEAATIPIAFLTTHYALNHLGRMRRGERVLIHSATGGVGLAAIQLARRAGAEVYATAGSPEKRDFLRSLGVEHVWDSRSLDFADGVLEATGGRGVDIVLNSLAGEAIRRGLAVLGDWGRFLEIGKRDIYADSRVGLRPFKRNLSFMAIDLDLAMRERPEELAAQFQELMEAVGRGELKPLPYRVFPVSNAVGAFRYMTKAKHIGKVVVSMHEPEVAIAPASFEGLVLCEDATYLMTGGLGGFGLVVAQWMIERGARHLVLMGRSGASSPEAAEAVRRMREAGAEVVVAQADVTEPADVARVLGEIDRAMPPLKGVLHAAMVLRDRLLVDLDHQRMREVWSPKVDGAWNLHTQTRDRDLDFFVLFSSLSSVFGIGGQANYASANAFLDSLSYWRQSQGLPSVTVSWGYLGQVGWVARHEEIAERLEHQGVRSFTPQQALTLLGRFLQEEPAHVGVMHIDWKRWGEAAGSSMIAPRFADLVRAGAEGVEQAGHGGAALRRALLEAAPAERHELMVGILRDQVARVLGASPAKLDLAKPLTELGLDSLMAVELRNWIEGDLRLSLPTVELMKGPSVLQLADLMLAQVAKLDPGSTSAKPAAASLPQADAAPAAPPEELLAQVDEMPDEQVDALLREMSSNGTHGEGALNNGAGGNAARKGLDRGVTATGLVGRGEEATG